MCNYTGATFTYGQGGMRRWKGSYIKTNIQFCRIPPQYLLGALGMISSGQYTFWPKKHRKILKMADKWKPCTDIAKNLKPVTPALKRKPLENCSEPNEGKQIDFVGPNTNEKDQDVHTLAWVDQFSKYPTVESFDITNNPNVVKSLDDHIQIHGVPLNICFDQARRLKRNKMKDFCRNKNIKAIAAAASDHWAIGLAERLKQTIKKRLNCMKLASKSNTFKIKESNKPKKYQLRFCKQKTTNVTPFPAHFGRKPRTLLSNTNTAQSNNNLTYAQMMNHYLDTNTVSIADYPDDNGWDSA